MALRRLIILALASVGGTASTGGGAWSRPAAERRGGHPRWSVPDAATGASPADATAETEAIDFEAALLAAQSRLSRGGSADEAMDDAE